MILLYIQQVFPFVFIVYVFFVSALIIVIVFETFRIHFTWRK